MSKYSFPIIVIFFALGKGLGKGHFEAPFLKNLNKTICQVFLKVKIL